MPKMRRLALQAMSAYYVASGLWPIASRRTFEAATGPKADFWLVQMVALLAIANGIAIGAGARRRKIREETVTLALLTAAAFATIDVVHVGRGRIPPVYLGDAAVEALFAALILAG